MMWWSPLFQVKAAKGLSPLLVLQGNNFPCLKLLERLLALTVAIVAPRMRQSPYCFFYFNQKLKNLLYRTYGHFPMDYIFKFQGLHFKCTNIFKLGLF